MLMIHIGQRKISYTRNRKKKIYLYSLFRFKSVFGSLYDLLMLILQIMYSVFYTYSDFCHIRDLKTMRYKPDRGSNAFTIKFFFLNVHERGHEGVLTLNNNRGERCLTITFSLIEGFNTFNSTL